MSDVDRQHIEAQQILIMYVFCGAKDEADADIAYLILGIQEPCPVFGIKRHAVIPLPQKYIVSFKC